MPRKRFTIEQLKQLAASKNIAQFLDEPELNEMGQDVCNDFDEDFGRMSHKINQWRDILDQVMQVKEEKNFPWPNASNMKYPLIAEACIEFSSNIYPEIVQPNRIVRIQVNGEDPNGEKQARADRVEKHLNYQLTEKIKNWEPDMDALLFRIPAYGCYYKKIYFDQSKNVPVVNICSPDTVITSSGNNSLDDERRITHTLSPLSKNDVIERIRKGIFLNVDMPQKDKDTEEDDDEKFIEQHCWLDLDEDGYKEPYTITVHRESQMVFRIVARFTEDDIQTVTTNRTKDVIASIEGFTHFVKYPFFRSFDGSNTDLGFGELLIPLNEQINSNINQLTDSGTLQTIQGGFLGKGIRMDSGPFRVSMGEWLPVESRGGSLGDNIFPIPTKEPSQTLFALLGMMIDMARGLSQASKSTPGEIPANTPATTFLGWIEEGMKVYSSIHKRIYNATKQEIRKIYRLNSLYGDPEEYEKYQDMQDVDMLEDYAFADEDISPAASPEVSTNMQRLIQAQSLIGMDRQIAQAGGLDPRAAMRRYLEATKQPNIEELQPPPEPVPEGPTLEQQMLDMQANIERGKLDLKAYELEIKEMTEYIKGVRNLAEAEAVETGTQLKEYQQGVQDIKDGLEIERTEEELNRQAIQQQGAQPIEQQPQ